MREPAPGQLFIRHIAGEPAAARTPPQRALQHRLRVEPEAPEVAIRVEAEAPEVATQADPAAETQEDLPAELTAAQGQPVNDCPPTQAMAE